MILWTAGAAVAATPDPPIDGAELYRKACAACHGAEGRLDPTSPLWKNFESPPADLSDPLFNSREPRADWDLVVSHGGASIGLSSQMPAFDQALSREQIDAVLDHIQALADTSGYPPGDLNFLRPIQTIKAFPEDEALILNSFRDNEVEDDSLATTLYYARRFGKRSQGEIKAVHLRQGDNSDLDEIELGFKHALRFDLEAMSLLSAGVELAIPVEDDDATEEIIPYLSWAKGLSAATTFQGTLKAKLPTDEPGDGEVGASAIVHWMPSPWPRSISPALELALTEPLESGKDFQASLIPQLYFGLSKLGHVALAVGAEVPLTDEDYDVTVRTFLLWDIADGPFWSGWK